MDIQSHVKAMDIHLSLSDAHKYYDSLLGINTGCNVNSITKCRRMKLVKQSSTVEPFPGNGELNVVGNIDAPINISDPSTFDAYIRHQNSVHEDREHQCLINGDASSSCFNIKHAATLSAAGQNHKVEVFLPVTEEYASKDVERYTEKHTERTTKTCNISTNSGDVECGKETQGEAVSSWGRSCCLVSVGVLLGFLLTCVVLIPLHFRVMRQRNLMCETSPPLYLESRSDNWPVIELRRPTDDTRSLAKFLLDQETYKDKGTIRWKPSSETINSTITASVNESCVSVPEDGCYCVLSQLTYAFTGSTTAKQVGHNLMVVHDGAENVVQKKLITVPFRDTSLPLNQKVLEPSNLLTYVLVKSGDKICVKSEPPGLLYVSSWITCSSS